MSETFSDQSHIDHICQCLWSEGLRYVDDYGGLDYLVIKSDRAIDVYKKLMNRTANRRRSIKKDVFLKIEIPVPPLNVRREIVNLLKGSSALRKKADKLIEESKILANQEWNLT